MEWTKIPTTLISKRYTDYELISIVKFQLLWAELEEQPDKKTALRYMTSKQYDIALTYLDSIVSSIAGEVSSVINKRNREKIRYNKNKDLSKILPADSKQNVGSLPEQIRLDKIREDNIPPVSKDTVPQRVTRFQKPTIDEIRVYCSERNNGIIAESFYDFYESKGWKVGSSPMKDWKAAVRNWERKRKNPQKTTQAEEVFNHNFAHLQSLFEGEDNAQ